MNDNGLGIDNPVMMELLLLALLKNLGRPVPVGGDGEPKPINPAFDTLVLASGISSLISSAFPNPEGDDNIVHGPLGPVIRDISVALAVTQLAAAVTDKDV